MFLMSDVETFIELLRRVRLGEPDAAYELVRQYEMDIRIAVRARLSDPALRQQFDSMDICQSVLASFFLRAAAGQYDLHQPGQLVGLLTRMAQNKLAMQARSHYQQRRDVRRVRSINDLAAAPADKSSDPGRQAVDRDLLRRSYELMDAEVRQMADCRVHGAQWGDIAAKLGGTADARRKQFFRAMDRIAQTLEID
jgi:DNA-directed RNA polymerase specialized sigma24 family protein